MNRILIIGATGFVGKATLRALLESNAGEIHAVYNKTQPETDEAVSWHKVNVLNHQETETLIRKISPTHIVQLAWCAEHGTYWKDHANLDWQQANVHIARCFKKYGGKRCLFLGTSAEYEWAGNDPLNEFKSPLKPQGLYGGAKLGLYWTLARFFEQEGISWIWARLFNPFGPGEDMRRLIPKICLRLLNGETISFDAGLSQRDFLYVNDVGNALVKALLSETTGAVNIGSGQALRIRDVISQIAANYGCPERVSFDSTDNAANLPDAVVADVSRLVEECGWQPEKNFTERLIETCEWWKIKQKQIKKI
jgi:nucleoside-diphosphate-sugar epimerase